MRDVDSDESTLITLVASAFVPQGLRSTSATGSVRSNNIDVVKRSY